MMGTRSILTSVIASARSARGNPFAGCLCVALFGAMMPLSMAPHHWQILPFVSIVGWLWFLQADQTTLMRAAFLGLAYGIGVYGFGIRWLYHSVRLYGGLAPWLSVIMVAFMALAMAAVFFMLLPCLFVWLGRRQSTPFSAQKQDLHPAMWVVLWPSLWVFFEFLKTYLFTGFPWLLLGDSQLGWPLAGMAPILGVYGVSWVTVCVASSLYVLCMSRHASKYGWMCPAIVLCLLSAYWGQVTWTYPEGKPVTVNVVQPNVALRDKWDPQKIPAVLRQYGDAIREAPPAHIYVLPEGALPSVVYGPIRAWLNAQQQRAHVHGYHLMVGAMLDEGPYNGLLMLGKHQGVYTKQHLVPFGEYIPFEKWLSPVFEWLNAPMSRLKVHPNAHQALYSGVAQITPVICYETAYPGALAARVAHTSQGNVLLAVSEDAWFGPSDEPGQHLQGAQMRALETGRPIIFSTNQGISALVQANGRIQQQTTWGQASVLHGKVQPRGGATPWVQWGRHGVFWLNAVILLAAILLHRWYPLGRRNVHGGAGS